MTPIMLTLALGLAPVNPLVQAVPAHSTPYDHSDVTPALALLGFVGVVSGLVGMAVIISQGEKCK